jgi:hypothetical protein
MIWDEEHFKRLREEERREKEKESDNVEQTNDNR